MLDFMPLLDEGSAGPEPRAGQPLPLPDSKLLDGYSQTVSGVVDRVGPAVVKLDVRKAGRPAGSGSGVILSPDGLVLTNSHVAQATPRVSITTQDGRIFDARLIGDDPDTDLALVHIEQPVNLMAARLGNSKELRRGQIAIAI